MITFAQFIQDYPEFGNASQAQFTLCQTRAAIHLSPAWGLPSVTADPSTYTQYDVGMELVIAHFLTRAAVRALAAGANGGPALARGVITSESAGQVSVNYDAASAVEEGAGHWNETDYGREYVQQARLIGAGPAQVSPAPNCNGALNGPAWPGPWPYPGYFG